MCEMAAGDDFDWILVEGLEFETIIGIHPGERSDPQPLRLDLQLGVHSIRAAAGTDAIESTVDYQQVCEQVMALVNAGQFQLVETLVERVAEALFEHFPVQRVRIRAVKPLALPYTRGVGAQIVRDRPAEAPGQAEAAD